MGDQEMKIIEYVDYLKRREKGHTWAGEHAYFYRLEDELKEILSSPSDSTSTEHPDTVSLQAVRDILDEQEGTWRNAGASKKVREAGVAAE
ncbi:MAG TPA: hypothetical protein VNA25_23335 [Phycisphaerae bacterium]|nr:hypothetical protein [Phycisphaerae bacterium]